MNQIYPLRLLTVVAFACSLSIASTVKAQINGSGVSDSALFDTVINIPGDSDIFTSGIIGGIDGETTQLNISSGSIGPSLTADLGSEVNLSGGSIDSYFSVTASEVNISGGNVGGVFFVENSMVNLSGGGIIGLRAVGTSEINISGGIIENNLFVLGGTANVTGEALQARSLSLACRP